jgi:mono/diheme cytochrome c family protein
MTVGILQCAASIRRWGLSAGFSIVFCVLSFVPMVHAQEPWRVPPQARARRNPLLPSVAAVGARIFATNCATCHGAAGKGDGLAAAALNPRPRDLTSQSVQSEPDGALFWKITRGRGAMPAWPWLPERERWALVWMIRELGRAAASGITQ